jgi:hypothetical protein
MRYIPFRCIKPKKRYRIYYAHQFYYWGFTHKCDEDCIDFTELSWVGGYGVDCLGEAINYGSSWGFRYGI